MAVNPIDGTLAANTLTGSATADLIYGAGPALTAATAPGLVLVRNTGLGDALFATEAPGQPGVLYVLQKAGLIQRVDSGDGSVAATPFLDVVAEIDDSGEQGLLGLAFHPDFVTNGRFYVYLSNLAGDSEIREYAVDPADPSVVLPGSGRVLLTVPQPEFSNHKGGWIGFGSDGLLYIATGDGGSGGDPLDNGQDITDLLGSILRIDVNTDAFPGDPTRDYGIPASNPFAGATTGADEIWTFGLRNPFRDSFDRGTGTLWIADVGQGRREEIDLGFNGANYGWRLFEGTLTYPDGNPATPPAGITPPIFDYDHASGDRSITGGYVYRGPESGLQGRYIFGDFVSGRIYALDDLDGDGTYTRVLLDDSTLGAFQLTSFGEDGEGNLYAVARDGRLFRIDPGAPTGTIDGGDFIRAGGGADRVFAGAGDDSARGGDGADLLSGMEGADTLKGEDAADSLVGGGGDDRLTGGLGRDTLLGGTGADRLSGGNGADVLAGGEGADRLTGGTGADRFVYGRVVDSATPAADTIADFLAADGDRIDVSALVDGPFVFIGTAAFTAADQVRAAVQGGRSVVELSLDGATVAMTILVSGTTPLGADAFLL